jgi:phage FluMu protein Com
VKEYCRGQAVLQFEVNCQKCKSVNVIDLNVDPPVNAQEDVEVSYDDEKKSLA